MEFTFKAKMWEWRGPAPFYFMSLPEQIAQEIQEQSAEITYGWGMIPVTATIGKTTFETSMFRKNGTYVLPIKNLVRLPEALVLDVSYKIHLSIK